MDGQAAGLRARIAAADGRLPAADGGPAPARALARTLAVASGKGGVGKSTVALGIAMAAAERGVKTALVDADLGLANLDLMCGIRPARTAADWLGGRARLSECFVTVAPRLWLLPGASGIAQLADLPAERRQRFVDGLARVAGHVELMVIDLGAGIGAGTLDVASAADRLLLVATPEPTSLADAYGFAKACARHGRAGEWWCTATMVRSDDEGNAVGERLAAVAKRHLSIDLRYAGCVPSDDAVRAAVRARVPLLAQAPRSPAARSVRAIEGRLAGTSSPVQAGWSLASLGAVVGARWGGAAAAIAAGVAGLGGVASR